MTREKRRGILIFSVIFAIGLAIFLVPPIYLLWHRQMERREIAGFSRMTQELPTDSGIGNAEKSDEIPKTGSGKTADGKAAAGKKAADSPLRQAMEAYNRTLFLTAQTGLADQDNFEEPDFHPQDYGVESDVLGYISIPSISVELPVYNGSSQQNMARGATLLAKTSLPIGGENTNAVIAAHTKYKGVDMFRRITELRPGDMIRITNYFETLEYKVAETRVIYPDEVENIYIQEGSDLITLSTCHPYPDNYQRYLVIAERSAAPD